MASSIQNGSHGNACVCSVPEGSESSHTMAGGDLYRSGGDFYRSACPPREAEEEAEKAHESAPLLSSSTAASSQGDKLTRGVAHKWGDVTSKIAITVDENNTNNIDINGNTDIKVSWLHVWLYRLKTYFLFAHVGYVLVIMLITAILTYVSENYWGCSSNGRSSEPTPDVNSSSISDSFLGDSLGYGYVSRGSTSALIRLRDHPSSSPSCSPPLSFIDAVFIAASAVSCTGLSTVDVSKWNRSSSFVRNTATVLCGMIFTSGAMPLLRLVTLRRLRKDTRLDANTAILNWRNQQHSPHLPVLVQWHARKEAFISRIEASASLSALVTYGYFIFWHIFGVIFIYVGGQRLAASSNSSPENTSPYSISMSDAVEYTIAAFQNCGFVSMSVFASSTAIVSALGLLNAVGGALYPPLLRVIFFSALRTSLFRERFRERRRNARRSYGTCVDERVEGNVVNRCGLLVDEKGRCYGGARRTSRADDVFSRFSFKGLECEAAEKAAMLGKRTAVLTMGQLSSSLAHNDCDASNASGLSMVVRNQGHIQVEGGRGNGGKGENETIAGDERRDAGDHSYMYRRREAEQDDNNIRYYMQTSDNKEAADVHADGAKAEVTGVSPVFAGADLGHGGDDSPSPPNRGGTRDSTCTLFDSPTFALAESSFFVAGGRNSSRRQKGRADVAKSESKTEDKAFDGKHCVSTNKGVRDHLIDGSNYDHYFGLESGCDSSDDGEEDHRNDVRKSARKQRQLIERDRKKRSIAQKKAFDRSLMDCIWEGRSTEGMPTYFKALLAINYAPQPSLHHFFLFSWSDSLYLVAAFLFINGAQMLPFLVQQWEGPDGVLAPFPAAQKVLISLSQSILVRFSGTTLVDVLKFSNVHILWILFAMYIPVVPIPNERAKRKWKAMIKAGIMRLATSRLFLLFLSTSIIVWIEEDRLRGEVVGTSFDVTTRVLFETVSGYATSGMTLPLASSVSSFSSSFSTVCKLIIAANMVIGRHRWMDLGIDIGLDALAVSEHQVEERLRLLVSS